jgi:hypothetical protein
MDQRLIGNSIAQELAVFEYGRSFPDEIKRCSMEYTKLYYVVQVLQLAALECSEQIKSFPNFVAVPDEIAVTLNDTILAFEHSDEVAELDSTVFERIKKLDQYYDNPEKDEYNVESLCHSPRWNLSRKMAKEILAMLGQSATKPDLSWMRFIKGAS